MRVQLHSCLKYKTMEEKLTSFTKEVDAWIEDNCPQSMRTPMPVSEQV